MAIFQIKMIRKNEIFFWISTVLKDKLVCKKRNLHILERYHFTLTADTLLFFQAVSVIDKTGIFMFCLDRMF